MASCTLVERFLPLLCVGLLPQLLQLQLAMAMRCRVPYEKVQQNYCYYISDVNVSEVCHSNRISLSCLNAFSPFPGDLLQQPVLPGQAYIACVPRQRRGDAHPGRASLCKWIPQWHTVLERRSSLAGGYAILLELLWTREGDQLYQLAGG